MWILPRSGLNVRNPVTMQLLPEAGDEVSDTDQHWNRALASGDVVRGTAPTTPAAPLPVPVPAQKKE